MDNPSAPAPDTAVNDIAPTDNLDALPSDPTREQYQTEDQQEKWIKELEAARKERHKFDEAGVKTIRRYADQREGDVELQANRYNLFYANTEIKSSILYSRTPQPDIRRRFMDANDAVSRVAGNIMQRAATIEMDLDGFDQKFKQILFDYLVPGFGVGWVRYEEEKDPDTVQQVVDPTTGEVIEQTIPGAVTEQSSPIDYVAWDDFLYPPCQVWTDCRWVARRVPMNKDAIKARFGSTVDETVLSSLSYTAKKKDDKATSPTDKLKPKNVTESTTDVYEIWDKECKCIFWINESSTTPLDVQPDTNKFQDFFPTPLPPLGRYTTASTIPRSDFAMAQDKYDMLDALQTRAAKLIDCIKVKWVYDSTRPELAELFTTVGENKGIGVKDWTQWQQDKGGMPNSIQFVPIDNYVSALEACLKNIQILKQDIMDVEGIADFMRGQTQAYDSAAAITQKGNFAATRVGTVQKNVALYIEKLVRLKVHIMSKFYKPEILVDHAGALPDEDKQYLGPAIQLLKSNFETNFRLNVSVDSIQDATWSTEKAERVQLTTALGQFIAQALPGVKETPELAPLTIQLIKWTISAFKGSADIEGILDAALAKLAAAGAQGGPPKPPSDAQIKAQTEAQRNQTDLQIAQVQEQTKVQVAQIEAGTEQQKTEVKAKELALKAFDVHSDHNARAVEGSHNIAMDLALGGQ